MKLKLFINTLILTSLSISQNVFGYAEAELNYGQTEVESEPLTSISFLLSIQEDNIWNNFGLGAGVRFSRYTASEYAPSKERSEVLEDMSVTSTNLYGQVHYRVGNFKLGFNLDIIGNTVGNESDTKNSSLEVSPLGFNQFAGGENDQGSLNSQLFLAYYLGEYFISIGSAHTVLEFADNGLDGDDRRQRFFDSFFIGIGGTYSKGSPLSF